MLCRGCGHEIDALPCPYCGPEDDRSSVARRENTQLCPGCGNDVPADRPCPVCSAGRGRRKATREESWTMCRQCGNSIRAGDACSVCDAGRGGRRRTAAEGPVCPQCDDPLEEQSWDGIDVCVCPTCQGALFPPRGLEELLNKLREMKDEQGEDVRDILRDLRGDARRVLPEKVRYLKCPMCGDFMPRRNYAGVSGIILSQCADHGHWVSQQSFGELSDFISRGGDLLAKRNPLRRRR